MYKRLEKNQLTAIKLILSNEHAIGEIAELCNVSRMTLWKWRQQPLFKKTIEIELTNKQKNTAI